MAEQKNILIVDDDIELGSLLAKAVSDMSSSYNVKVARDVDEAMVQVRKSQTSQHAFDLVITDIKMSGLSGLELLEALHTIAPEAKTIAMTAYNSSEIADRAKELKVEAYLTKPFIISEFRQIVRDTLNTPSSAPDDSAPRSDSPFQMPADLRTSITRELASLRTMIGAAVTILAHNSGAVLAVDTPEAGTDMEGLCAALLAAQQAVAQQMARTFGQNDQIRQSYFGTDAFSVCAYRLDDNYSAAVVFGPAVREGQVWYYLRDASSTLKDLLSKVTVQPQSQQLPQADVSAMVERFLPRLPQRKRRREMSASTVVSATPKRVPQQQAQAGPGIDVPSLDKVDWGSTPEMSWEDVVEGTDRSFDGLSFDQAQQQGLVPQEVAATEHSGEPVAGDQASVDEIDWSVEPEADWDSIAAETDKGLTGFSYEEARERGLITDIDE